MRPGHPSRPALRQPPRGAGYSLIEMLVSMTLTMILMLGFLELFDSNAALSRVQIQVADLQQSSRVSQNYIVRMIRMAGRGGLPEVVMNAGTVLQPALTVTDNVPAGTNVVPADNATEAVEGSDVLTIRGAFTAPLYPVSDNALTLFDAGGDDVTGTPGLAVTGRIVVTDPGPTGLPQDLQPLADMIAPGGDPAQGQPEALILVSRVSDQIYAVVELDPANSVVGANQISVGFNVFNPTHPTYRNLYASGGGGNPVLPAALTEARMVGVIEEYRFYVRNTEPSPVLSMARMFPATQVTHRGVASNGRLDIADSVIDLQVALGFDSDLGAAPTDINGDLLINEEDIVITETTDGSNDDWLFNGANDNPNSSPWTPPWDDNPATAPPRQPELYYVRLSTLVRARSPERTFQSPLIQRLENRVVAPLNTDFERLHRRQLQQTVIDMRSL